MSDFAEWKKVNTRKPHVCNGCFVEIPVGSTVTYGSGKFEGDMFSVHLCDECHAYLEHNSDVMLEGWCPGDLGMARRDEERWSREGEKDA